MAVIASDAIPQRKGTSRHGERPSRSANSGNERFIAQNCASTHLCARRIGLDTPRKHPRRGRALECACVLVCMLNLLRRSMFRLMLRLTLRRCIYFRYVYVFNCVFNVYSFVYVFLEFRAQQLWTMLFCLNYAIVFIYQTQFELFNDLFALFFV